MARLTSTALLAAIILAATSCAWSAPDSGVGVANQSAQLVPSARWGSHIRAWQGMLRATATDNPTATYPTPTRSLLLQRLHQTSVRYGFRVVSLRILDAPQGSPQVIVQTAKPSTFARSVPAIMRALDPHHPAAEDWLGWSYEGFFLGAQDSQRDPFLAVFNTMRAHSGGQWARTEQLFPYPHG
jgi:hypothetical protein